MRITLALWGLLIGLFAQAQEQPVKQLDKKKKIYEVLASCGTCNFKMKAEGCPLAIKWNDKVYLVEGTSIDDHGDAHADDGFCNAVKKAKVQGTFEGNRFKSTYFEIVKAGNTKKE
jgi:hypothetical protein